MIKPTLKLKHPTKEIGSNKQQSFSHEILLTSCNGDLQKFPAAWDVKARVDCYNNNGEVLMLEAFWRSLKYAVSQILILDSYFLNPEVSRNSSNKTAMIEKRVLTIQNELIDTCINGKSGLKIKILTDSPYTSDKEKEQKMLKSFEEIEELSQGNKQQGNTGVELNLCLNLTKRFDYIHDRFAIVDDELWHFGGTVGGFNSRFSVASRGWDAEALNATKFFNEVWQECNR